jgi:aspartate aminotransferase-like enzyme
MIEIFFTKRHEFGSAGDYFAAIERRMKAVSLFGFYLAFPQLVRFMKDENRNKAPMDQHYALRLRALAVGKELLCHAFDRYSQLLEFLREAVRAEVEGRCE